MTKREDGYYWVRGIGELPFGGGRAMVAEWRDGAWGFAADGETRSDRHFEVLSEKLEPPAERSPFAVIADMAAKQMAETIREDRVKPLKEFVYVKLAESSKYGKFARSSPSEMNLPESGIGITVTERGHVIMEMDRASAYPAEFAGAASEVQTYFAVSVRDDHDGGSVWYVDEDYIEERTEAEELAVKTSLKRENGSARLLKVTAEVAGEFFEGRPRVRN